MFKPFRLMFPRLMISRAAGPDGLQFGSAKQAVQYLLQTIGQQLRPDGLVSPKLLRTLDMTRGFFETAHIDDIDEDDREMAILGRYIDCVDDSVLINGRIERSPQLLEAEYQIRAWLMLNHHKSHQMSRNTTGTVTVKNRLNLQCRSDS